MRNWAGSVSCTHAACPHSMNCLSFGGLRWELAVPLAAYSYVTAHRHVSVTRELIRVRLGYSQCAHLAAAAVAGT